MAAYLALFLVASAVPPLLVALLLDYAGLLPVQTPARFDPGAPFQVLLYAASFVTVVGLTWLFCRRFDRRSLLDLGLRPRGPWLRHLAAGFVLGALLMLLIFLVELSGGWYRMGGYAWQQVSAARIVQAIGVSLVLFWMAATLEELAFRGYVLQTLERGWGLPAALAASSCVFAALHLVNPDADLLSTLALTVAGLLLGCAYLVSRALWLPIGLHLAWNFFQGPVFGFPVSGLSPGGLVRLTPVGPRALTGGGFGPEASLVGVTAELLGIGLLWLWARRSRAATA